MINDPINTSPSLSSEVSLKASAGPKGFGPSGGLKRPLSATVKFSFCPQNEWLHPLVRFDSSVRKRRVERIRKGLFL